MSESKKIAYEPELDGLRAIAVLGVLFFHLGIGAVGGGFTGVDIFFVLSGYLITALIWPRMEDKSFSFTDFYIRRARRLLPALFLVILLSSIASWLLLSPDHLASFSRSAFHAAISVSNFNFWLESGYFESDKFTKPLLHTWSLGVEEQFYLFWPLFVSLLVILRIRVLQFLILLIATGAGFALSIYFLDTHPNAVFYLSPFRAWQFAAGGLAALILHQGSSGGRKFVLPQPVSLVATLVGLGLVIYGFMKVSPYDYPGWHAVIPTVAAVLLIFGGGNFVARPLLANSVARFFGRISYSLYLTHWPLIVFWRYYNNAPLSVLDMLIVSTLAIASAYVMFRFIEVPLRQPWTQTAKVERLAVPAGILSALSALLILSVYPWSQNGWPWRLPADSQKVLAEMASTNTMKCRMQAIAGLGKQCFFGRNLPAKRAKSADILVIGDSHAGALAKGLDSLLKKDGLSAIQFMTPGMIPFFGAQTYDDQKGRKDGFDPRLEWAAKSNADLIIIHARFSLHWLSERPAGNRGSPEKYVGAFGQPAPASIEESQAYFLEGLDKTIALFAGSKAKVIIVGAVPYQGVNFNQCINRPAIVMSVKHMIDTCGGFTRAQAMARAEKVNQILRQAVAGTDIQFIDPTEVFCPKYEATCLRVVNGNLVFRDEDHLNPFGARILGREVLKVAGLSTNGGGK